MMLKKEQNSVQLTADQEEKQTLKKLEHFLNAKESQPIKINSNGEEILLPESVNYALRQVIHAMALGKCVTIVADDQYMTLQEASDFLNVSRPYLITLLEQEEIPVISFGSNQQILCKDIANYKQNRDIKRRQHLNELTAFLQDEGFYNDHSFDLIR